MVLSVDVLNRPCLREDPQVRERPEHGNEDLSQFPKSECCFGLTQDEQAHELLMVRL
jgi:hypothetical protein